MILKKKKRFLKKANAKHQLAVLPDSSVWEALEFLVCEAGTFSIGYDAGHGEDLYFEPQCYSNHNIRRLKLDGF